MTLTLAQRREILASMPWVAVSPRSELFDKRCEGFRTDIPLSFRVQDNELQYRVYRCKKRARWVFLALDGSIHTFCWHHLFIYGLESTREEEMRYQAWLNKYMEIHPVPPDWIAEEPDEPLGRN